MTEKFYRIRLVVPLGVRNGTMTLHETEGNIDGWLSVMGEKNSFSGTLTENGQITVAGTLRTLIATIYYSAVGTISGREILMNLKTNSGAYYSISGEEFFIDDKIL